MKKSKFEDKYLKSMVKSKKEKTTLVALRLPDSLYLRIRDLAKSTNMTMTSIIIDALNETFEINQNSI